MWSVVSILLLFIIQSNTSTDDQCSIDIQNVGCIVKVNKTCNIMNMSNTVYYELPTSSRTSIIVRNVCTKCTSTTTNSTCGKMTLSPSLAMTSTIYEGNNSITSTSSPTTHSNITSSDTSNSQETGTMIYSLLGIMLFASCSLNIAMMFITVVLVKKRRHQYTHTLAESEQQEYVSIHKNSYGDMQGTTAEDVNLEPTYAVVNKPKRSKDSRQTPPPKPHPLGETDNRVTHEEKDKMTKQSSYEVVTLDYGAESINVKRQYDASTIPVNSDGQYATITTMT